MEDEQQNEQAAAVGGALERFPMVVWERILEAADSTQDILNLFAAFPELKRLSKGNEFSWLIGEVLSLILPKHLDPVQNLNCRLVSKRWNNAFGTMLENHPARLPYKSPEISNAGISTDHRFISPSSQRISTNFRKFMRSGFANADGGEGHNPFPGRQLAIDLYLTPEDYPSRIIKLSEGGPYFQKFGHHVSSLKGNLFCKHSGENQDFIRDFGMPLLRWLSFFPNLKSLELDSYYGIGGEENVVKSLATIDSIPVMPFKLEILDICELNFYNRQSSDCSAIYNWLVPILITHDKVKGLRLNRSYWNPQNLPSLFPQLSDLKVDALNCVDLGPLFQQLLTDRVRKLTVYPSQDMDACDVLESLQPYKIECLVLESCYGCRKSFWNPLVTLQTITDITIYVTCGKAGFGFLKGLPSLEYLTIIIDESISLDDNIYVAENEEPQEDIGGNELHAFSGTVRSIWCAGDYVEEGNYAWKWFDSIWTLVPSLKVFNVHDTLSPRTLRQYVREVPNKVFKSTYYKQGY